VSLPAQLVCTVMILPMNVILVMKPVLPVTVQMEDSVSLVMLHISIMLGMVEELVFLNVHGEPGVTLKPEHVTGVVLFLIANIVVLMTMVILIV
jgi:hypothetical protein